MGTVFARARSSGRLVLLDLGTNRCPDRRLLNSNLHMPQMAAWKSSHFETVMVNVDRFNVNMDIPPPLRRDPAPYPDRAGADLGRH